MRRNWLSTAIGLVSLVALTAPAQRPAGQAQGAATKEPPPAAASPVGDLDVPCADVPSLARRGLDDALSASSEVSPGPVHSVIALVPDPVHTHLSLFFDRTIDAIQQGAQQSDPAHWQFDRQWLPWDGTGHPEPNDFRIRLKQDAWQRCLEELPGVMTFRGSSSEGRLLVFLVAESPTAGINISQFKTAFRMAFPAARVANAPAAVRVLGPTFSGSLASLERLLHDEISNPSATIDVRSGSATSEAAITAFVRDMTIAYPKRFTFRSLVADDSDALDHLFKWLRSRGYDREKVAVVSEDETAYGQLRGMGKALLLSYPREISRLRTAYQKGGLFDDQAGTTGRAPARSILRIDLGDTSQSGDTVPTFSDNHTPPSQEAVLLGLVEELRVHYTEILAIRATDPLDQVFLSRFFHRTYPRARIVMLGGDRLLLSEAADDPGFKGDLSVGSFHLMPGQEPGRNAPDQHTVFPSQYSDATHRALMELLGGPQAGVPPIFVDVIGDQGYWSMATLRAADPPQPEPAEPSHVAHTWQLLAPLVLAAAFGHWLRASRANIASPSEMVARFAPVQSSERVSMIGGSGLIVFAALLLIALPEVGLWAPGGGRPGLSENWKESGIVLCTLVAPLVFGVMAYRDVFRRTEDDCAPIHVLFLAGCLVGLAAVPVAMGWGRPNSAAFWRRYTHVESGLSPLLPMLWLILASYWWLERHITALAVSDNRRPRLPARATIAEAVGVRDEKLARDLSVVTDDQETADATTRWPRRRRHFAIAAGVLAAVATAAFDLEHPVKTFDTTVFEWTYAALLASVTLALLYSVFHFGWIWTDLQRTLAVLDRLPLRRGFARLGGYSWTPIWRPGTGTVRLHARGFSRVTESLNHVEQMLPESAALTGLSTANARVRQARADLEERFRSAVAALDETNQTSLLNQFSQIQLNLGQAGGYVVGWLGTQWAVERGLVADGDEESARRRKPSVVDTAEECACLLYANWITNRLALMRTIATQVGGTFVVASLSMAAYPFRQRNALGVIAALTLLAIILVIATIYARMHRDPVLSHLTNTTPDELGGDFWIRLGTFAAVPILSLVAVQWPQLGHAISTWVGPALDAVKLPR